MIDFVFNGYFTVALIAAVVAMARQDWGQTHGSCACLLAPGYIMPPAAV